MPADGNSAPDKASEGEVFHPGIARIIKLEAATSEDRCKLAKLYAWETSTKSLRTVADQAG